MKREKIEDFPVAEKKISKCTDHVIIIIHYCYYVCSSYYYYIHYCYMIYITAQSQAPMAGTWL